MASECYFLLAMTDRVQLNLRLDKHPKIYGMIRERAKREGSTINDYAINILARELGIENDRTPVGEALERISRLEKKLEDLIQVVRELSDRNKSESPPPPSDLTELPVEEPPEPTGETFLIQAMSVAQLPESLTQTKLAERLRLSRSVVANRRFKPNFSQWSRSLDPDNIAWKWNPRIKRFTPG